MTTGTEGLPEFGHVGDEVSPAVTDPRVLQAMLLMSGTGGVGEPEARAGSHGPGEGKDSVCDWEPTGRNMPAIPRRVAEKIRRGQYIDFSSLPPASGLVKQAPTQLEGGLVVIKAEDLARSRRIIPDIGVWHQCFTVWLSVVLKADPGRLQELLAYGYLITKCSKAFKWPSWVLYDQEFRQSKAGNTTARWDEVDTCLYTQHFSGKSEEVENWCPICCTADHGRRRCPAQQSSQKRLQAEFGAAPPSLSSRATSRGAQVCHKFNRFNGDCRRGAECPYRHVCSRCGNHHPAQRCPQQAMGLGIRGPENT